MQKGGEIMHTSSFEHIIRIQFNALMMTVIKCTVKSRNRQFARHSKRETLFCELSDMKIFEQGTEDNYSCNYIPFKVLNYTIQVSNEKLANALYKLYLERLSSMYRSERCVYFCVVERCS